jgi:hypothetical protein
VSTNPLVRQPVGGACVRSEGRDSGVGLHVVVAGGSMQGEGGALHEACEELERVVCRLLEEASRGCDELPTHTKNL